MEKIYKASKKQKDVLQDNILNNRNIKYQKQNNLGITLVALVITKLVPTA